MTGYTGNRFEFVKNDLVKVVDPAYSTYNSSNDVVTFKRIVTNPTWSYPSFVSASPDYTPQSASLGGGNQFVNGVIKIDPRTGPFPYAGSFDNPITAKHFRTYTDGAFQSWMGNPASDNGLTICGVLQIVNAVTGVLDWVDISAPAGGEAYQRENLIYSETYNPIVPPIPGSYASTGRNFGISSFSGRGVAIARCGNLVIAVVPQDSQPMKLRIELFEAGSAFSPVIVRTPAILSYGTTEQTAPWVFFCLRWKLPLLHKFATGGAPSQLPNVLTSAFGNAYVNVDNQITTFNTVVRSPSHINWGFNVSAGWNIGSATPGVGDDYINVGGSRWEFGWVKSAEPGGPRRSMNIAHLMIYDRSLTDIEIEVNRRIYKRRFPNLGLV
jgi:hypothetical protein